MFCLGRVVGVDGVWTTRGHGSGTIYTHCFGRFDHVRWVMCFILFADFVSSFLPSSSLHEHRLHSVFVHF